MTETMQFYDGSNLPFSLDSYNAYAPMQIPKRQQGSPTYQPRNRYRKPSRNHRSDICTLFVADVPDDCDPDDFIQLFENCEGYVSARIVRDRKGCMVGFVDFHTFQEAGIALKQFQGHRIYSTDEKGIVIKYATSTTVTVNPNKSKNPSSNSDGHQQERYRHDRNGRHQSLPSSPTDGRTPIVLSAPSEPMYMYPSVGTTRAYHPYQSASMGVPFVAPAAVPYYAISSQSLPSDFTLQPIFLVPQTSFEYYTTDSGELHNAYGTTQGSLSLSASSSESDMFKVDDDDDDETLIVDTIVEKDNSDNHDEPLKADDDDDEVISEERDLENITYTSPEKAAEYGCIFPSESLFVQGLPAEFTEKDVQDLFSPYYGYRGVRFVEDQEKKQHYCFVDFFHPSHSYVALSSMQGHRPSEDTIHGLQIYFAKDNVTRRASQS